MTKVTLWNNTDLDNAQRGLIRPEDVRTAEIEALVDTGATQMVIPIDVCLKPQGKTDVRLEVDWTTRHHDGEVHNRSTVIASRGQTFELDGGAVELAVSVQ